MSLKAFFKKIFISQHFVFPACSIITATTIGGFVAVYLFNEKEKLRLSETTKEEIRKENSFFSNFLHSSSPSLAKSFISKNIEVNFSPCLIEEKAKNSNNIKDYNNVLSRLKRNYYYTEEEIYESIVNLCPIELHIYICEEFLQDLQDFLKKIFCEKVQRESINEYVMQLRNQSKENNELNQKQGEQEKKNFISNVSKTAENNNRELLYSQFFAFLNQNEMKKNFVFLSKIEYTNIINESVKKILLFCDELVKEKLQTKSVNQLNIFQRISFSKNNETKNFHDEKVQKFINDLTDLWRDFIHCFLVSNWEHLGYMDKCTYKNVNFIGQHSTKFAGLNIGTKASNFLFENICFDNKNENAIKVIKKEKFMETSQRSRQNIDRATLLKVTKALNDYGVVILRNVFNEEELDKLKQNLYIKNKRSACDVGESMIAEDANVYCSRPTRGRLHCLIRSTRFEKNLEKVQSLWMSFVFAYLNKDNSDFSYENMLTIKRRKNINEDVNSLLDKLEIHKEINQSHSSINNLGNESKCEIMQNQETSKNYHNRIFVSDIQTITTDPLADEQIWFRDNSAKGLTVELALQPLNRTNGCTQILPSTHLFSFFNSPKSFENDKLKWKKFWNVFMQSEGCLDIEMEAGDILIYDSRILHRSLKNQTWNLNSKIIFRYDFDDTHPPGQNLIGIRCAIIFGKFNALISRFYKLF